MKYLIENQYIDNYEIEKFIIENKSLYNSFEKDFKGIKPKNCCGFLKINDEDYFIIPKICNEDEKNLNIFIYMLLFAYDIKIKNEDLSQLENIKYNFLKIFIKL